MTESPAAFAECADVPVFVAFRPLQSASTLSIVNLEELISEKKKRNHWGYQLQGHGELNQRPLRKQPTTSPPWPTKTTTTPHTFRAATPGAARHRKARRPNYNNKTNSNTEHRRSNNIKIKPSSNTEVTPHRPAHHRDNNQANSQVIYLARIRSRNPISFPRVREASSAKLCSSLR